MEYQKKLARRVNILFTFLVLSYFISMGTIAAHWVGQTRTDHTFKEVRGEHKTMQDSVNQVLLNQRKGM